MDSIYDFSINSKGSVTKLNETIEFILGALNDL